MQLDFMVGEIVWGNLEDKDNTQWNVSDIQHENVVKTAIKIVKEVNETRFYMYRISNKYNE